MRCWPTGVLVVVAAVLWGGSLAAAGIDESYHKPDTAKSWGDLLVDFMGLRGFSKTYALVIGVSEFEGYETLPTANDPLRMRDFLIDEAGFDYVHVLTDDKANKARIEELMVDILPAMIDENDQFLFYWSGHGEQRPDARGGHVGYLPLASSPAKRYSTMISMGDIQRWDDLLEAKQALFLLDACFSGLAGHRSMAGRRDLQIDQLAKPAHHLVSAGTGAERTIAGDRWGGSIFTDAILRAVRGEADAETSYPRDGVVSLTELVGYVKTRVSIEAPEAGWTSSMPQSRDLRSSDGEFFFLTSESKVAKLEGEGAEYQGRFEHGMPVVVMGATQEVPAAAGDPYGGRDVTIFDIIKESAIAKDFEDFIGQFPDSAFAPYARNRIALLQQREPAPPAPSVAVRIDPATEEAGLSLRPEDRSVVQEALTALGFDTRGADGIFGANTRGAIIGWQRSRGDEPTGYLSAVQHGQLLAEAEPKLAALAAAARQKPEHTAPVQPVVGVYHEQYTNTAPGAWLRPPLQLGHSGRVLAVAASPDARRIASGGDDSVRIWDAAAGRLERVLGPQTGAICAVGFSRDGARVAAMDEGTSTDEGEVHVWDLETGRRLQSSGPINTNACTIAFDSSGGLLALQGDTEELASWAADSPPRTVAVLEDSANALTSTPDGKTVAVIPCCDRSDVLELRNSHSGALQNSISLGGPSRELAFGPSGNRIAVSGMERAIEILDAETGERLQTLHTEIHRGIESIAFSPDGDLLAIASWNGQALEIWSVAEGRRRLDLGDPQPVSGVAWMPDGRRLVAGYPSGEIRIWDVDTGESTQPFPAGHGDNAVAISPDSRLLLLGTDGWDGSERVWNASIWELDTRRLRCSIEHAGPFKLAAFSPDHRWVALGNDSNYDVEIWDTQCEKKLGEVEVYARRGIAFTPDGRSVAYSNASSIVLRDLGTFEVSGVLEGHESDVSDMEFNARDGRLASAGQDGTVRIWDPATGRELRRIEAHRGVDWVAWSPDGTWLASTGDRYDPAGLVWEAAIWDAGTGALHARFPAFFDSGAHALRFAPDGTTLIAVSYDAGTLTRWNVADGRFLGELPLDIGTVSFRSILPAPDERTLALAIGKQEDGGPLLLVDLVTGDPRRMFRGLPDGGWVAVTPGGEIDGPHHGRP